MQSEPPRLQSSSPKRWQSCLHHSLLQADPLRFRFDYRLLAIVPLRNAAKTAFLLSNCHGVRQQQMIPLRKFVSDSAAIAGEKGHIRPYKSMEAVAAVGSKYFIKVVDEVKSLGSAGTLPVLEDLPAELTEVWRWRDIA